MKKLLLAVILVVVAMPAFAEDHATKSMFDPEFVLVSGALLGATAWDVHSTFHCIEVHACREGNSMMAPFVGKGQGAAYGIGLGSDMAVIALSDRMRKSHGFAHYIWWVPQVAGVVVHSKAALKAGQIELNATVRF